MWSAAQSEDQQAELPSGCGRYSFRCGEGPRRWWRRRRRAGATANSRPPLIACSPAAAMSAAYDARNGSLSTMSASGLACVIAAMYYSSLMSRTYLFSARGCWRRSTDGHALSRADLALAPRAVDAGGDWRHGRGEVAGISAAAGARVSRDQPGRHAARPDRRRPCDLRIACDLRIPRGPAWFRPDRGTGRAGAAGVRAMAAVRRGDSTGTALGDGACPPYPEHDAGDAGRHRCCAVRSAPLALDAGKATRAAAGGS